MGKSKKLIRLYLDCTVTSTSLYETGIQRVVRNFFKQLKLLQASGVWEVYPIALTQARRVDLDDELNPQHTHLDVALKSYLKKRLPRLHKFLRRSFLKSLLLPFFKYINRVPLSISDPVTLEPELRNVLFLIDSNWNHSVWEYVDKFRKDGGTVIAMLYDLIPLQYPDTVEDKTKALYLSWWGEALSHVDGIICISKSVRDQLASGKYLNIKGSGLSEKNICSVTLGADLIPDDTFIQLLQRRRPFFLMVGSIEPRKNHPKVLAAFNEIWNEGYEVDLVIISNNSWKSDAFLLELESNRHLNRFLFKFDNLNNRELAAMYAASGALIQASIAEGFGLPIVEALMFGKKVLCSDIPIFREVAGERAIYFDPRSISEIKEKILHILNLDPAYSECRAIENITVSWGDSAKQLSSLIREFANLNHK